MQDAAGPADRLLGATRGGQCGPIFTDVIVNKKRWRGEKKRGEYSMTPPRRGVSWLMSEHSGCLACGERHSPK